MYATTQQSQVTYAWLFRGFARLGGIIVMISWLALAVSEAIMIGSPAPSAYAQAGVLGLVFAGYVIGWTKETLGGVLAVGGTVLFFVVHFMTFGFLPMASAAMLALPGIFYLLARYAEVYRGGEVREYHER